MKQVLRSFGGFDSIFASEGEGPSQKDDQGSETASTGLKAITGETKITEVNWAAWLDGEAVEQILKQFGDKNFADLPESGLDFLRSRPKLPPELWAYLKGPAGKGAKSAPKSAAKPSAASSAPKSATPSTSKTGETAANGASKPANGSAPQSAKPGDSANDPVPPATVPQTAPSPDGQ